MIEVCMNIVSYHYIFVNIYQNLYHYAQIIDDLFIKDKQTLTHKKTAVSEDTAGV